MGMVGQELVEFELLPLVNCSIHILHAVKSQKAEKKKTKL